MTLKPIRMAAPCKTVGFISPVGGSINDTPNITIADIKQVQKIYLYAVNFCTSFLTLFPDALRISIYYLSAYYLSAGKPVLSISSSLLNKSFIACGSITQAADTIFIEK